MLTQLWKHLTHNFCKMECWSIKPALNQPLEDGATNLTLSISYKLTLLQKQIRFSHLVYDFQTKYACTKHLDHKPEQTWLEFLTMFCHTCAKSIQICTISQTMDIRKETEYVEGQSVMKTYAEAHTPIAGAFSGGQGSAWAHWLSREREENILTNVERGCF